LAGGLNNNSSSAQLSSSGTNGNFSSLFSPMQFDDASASSVFQLNVTTGVMTPVECIPMPPPVRDGEEEEGGGDGGAKADAFTSTDLPPPVGSLLAGSTYTPEGRYGHIGVSAVPADVVYQHFQTKAYAKPVSSVKKKTTRNRNAMGQQENPTRTETLMYMYGGSMVRGSNGYCDPALFELVRVVVPAPLDSYLTFMSEMLAAGSKAPAVAVTAAGNGRPHTPARGSPKSQSPTSSRHGSRPTSRSASRPSSPQILDFDHRDSFAAEDDFANGFDFEGSGTGAGSMARGNIWQNLQGKRGYKPHEVPAPNGWSELKLALSTPLSSMYFESDLLKQQVAQMRSSLSSPSLFHPSSSSFAPLHSAPAALNSSMHKSHSQALHTESFAATANEPKSHTASSTRLNNKNVMFLDSAMQRIDISGEKSNSLVSTGRGGLRAHTAPAASASSGRFAATAPMQSHVRGNDEIAYAREERKKRVQAATIALKPVIHHKTKVQAREEFLKLFPLSGTNVHSRVSPGL
jgi:hypothetical protein